MYTIYNTVHICSTLHVKLNLVGNNPISPTAANFGYWHMKLIAEIREAHHRQQHEPSSQEHCDLCYMLFGHTHRFWPPINLAPNTLYALMDCQI